MSRASTIRKYLAEVEERCATPSTVGSFRRSLAETESHLRESAEESRRLDFTRLEARAPRDRGIRRTRKAYGGPVQEVEVVAGRGIRHGD